MQTVLKYAFFHFFPYKFFKFSRSQGYRDSRLSQNKVSRLISLFTQNLYLPCFCFLMNCFFVCACLSIGPFHNESPMPCTCQKTDPANRFVPKDELDDLQKRRAEEFRQHQIRFLTICLIFSQLEENN